MGRMLTMVKNKSYQLGMYEKAVPSTLTWIEKLNIAKSSGFDYLEISIDETDLKLSRIESSDPCLLELQAAIKETGVPVLSMCLSAHRKYPLGSHDPKIQERSLEIMEKACIFAVKLGVRIIQLAGYDVYYEESDDSTRLNFEKNLRLCVDLASKYGVILAFETMETLFMDTAKKSMTYVSQNNSPYLQVYPDLGNLTNASRISKINVKDDLRSASGHIVAAHLKEIVEGKYREIPYGQGDTHFKEALIELKKQGVALFVGEFWYVGSPEWKKDLRFANAYLRDLIENS
jgi:predicted hexulose-6-phosphate isomerase